MVACSHHTWALSKYPEWGYGLQVTGLAHNTVRWRNFLTKGMLIPVGQWACFINCPKWNSLALKSQIAFISWSLNCDSQYNRVDHKIHRFEMKSWMIVNTASSSVIQEYTYNSYAKIKMLLIFCEMECCITSEHDFSHVSTNDIYLYGIRTLTHGI